MKEHHLVNLYTKLLVFFPRAYREEYGEELQYAILMGVQSAEAQGRLSVLRLAWRELRDFPLAVLSAHIRERRGGLMNVQPGAYLPEGRLNGWKLLAISIPFLLGLFLIWSSQIAIRLDPLLSKLMMAVFGVLLVAWVIVLITGLVRRFPVWTLPSLGILFSGVGFVLQMMTLLLTIGMIFLVANPLMSLSGASFRLTRADILQVLPSEALLVIQELLFLSIMVLLTVVILMSTPSFRERLRQDWTLLSFFFYGLTLPGVFFIDEYQGLEAYQMFSLLVLTAGGVLFLVLPGRWQRLLALLVPAALSRIILSVGLYQIFPAQEFATSIQAARIWEALQPVLGLPVLLVLLLLPAGLPFVLRGPTAGQFEQPSAS